MIVTIISSTCLIKVFIFRIGVLGFVLKSVSKAALSLYNTLTNSSIECSFRKDFSYWVINIITSNHFALIRTGFIAKQLLKVSNHISQRLR